MFRSLLVFLALCSLASTAIAAEPNWSDITPRLEGCWDGDGLGGTVSECWVIAENGRADGLFVLRSNNSPNFSEILTIDAFDDGVEMRLKHVGPDMTGWEEKDDFVKFSLLSVEPDRLIFKGLVLIFDGDDHMKAELQMTYGEGDVRTVTFDFVRTAHLNRQAPSD